MAKLDWKDGGWAAGFILFVFFNCLYYVSHMFRTFSKITDARLSLQYSYSKTFSTGTSVKLLANPPSSFNYRLYFVASRVQAQLAHLEYQRQSRCRTRFLSASTLDSGE